MSNELVPVEPGFEIEVMTGGPDPVLDYVDVLPDGELLVSTPLGEEDEEALEQGIASVFESLITADPDEDGSADADPTFVLLAELNRLWAEPLAA